jgi:hypothetical protein
MIDAARDHQQRHQGREQTSFPAFRQSGIVLARNDSGSDRDRFDVLGIDSVVISPGDNLDAFKNRVALAGVTPDGEDHFGRFVVLLELVRAGALGLVCVSGVCPARVYVDDEDRQRHVIELPMIVVSESGYDTKTQGEQCATRFTICQVPVRRL